MADRPDLAERLSGGLLVGDAGSFGIDFLFSAKPTRAG